MVEAMFYARNKLKVEGYGGALKFSEAEKKFYNRFLRS